MLLAIGHGEQSVADDGFVIGVAAGDARLANANGTLPEVEAGIGKEMGRGEGLWAALREVEVVGEGGRFTGGKLAMPRQGGGFGSGRQAIDEFDCQ